MPTYRVTTMWNQSIIGVSETFYTPNVSDVTAAGILDQMLANRKALMFANQFFVGVRLSVYGSKRQSTVLLPGAVQFPGTTRTLTIPTKGTRPYATLSTGPDQVRAVLQYRLGISTGHVSNRYLSGIPDDISATEPMTYVPGNSSDWVKAWNAWRLGLITDGWQIRARLYTGDYTPIPPIGVTVQTAAPGLLGVVLDSTAAGGFNRGLKIALTGWRPPKGERASTLNGTWIIDSVNDTLEPGETILYLRGSAGIDPTRQRFTDTTRVQLVGYDTFPIISIRPIRVCTHKRGRPSMAPRGRRLSRPSLDP